MKWFVGADHAGVALKRQLADVLRGLGDQVEDLGTNDDTSVDYPDYGAKVGQAVAAAGADARGLVVCGTGIGISIAANKVAGVRAAVVHDVIDARVAPGDSERGRTRGRPHVDAGRSGGSFGVRGSRPVEAAVPKDEAIDTRCLGDESLQRHHALQRDVAGVRRGIDERIRLGVGEGSVRVEPGDALGDEPARLTFDPQAGYKLLVEKKGKEPQKMELMLEYAKSFTKAPGQNSVTFQAPQAPVNHWKIRIPEMVQRGVLLDVAGAVGVAAWVTLVV